MNPSPPKARSLGAKFTCCPQESRQLSGECRQSAADRIPYDLDIEFEVTVGDPVAHAPHRRPGNLWMRGDESRRAFRDPRGRLPDQQQVQDDSLLGTLVAFEGGKIQPFRSR